MRPVEYLEILNTLSTTNKHFLISAYDISYSSDKELCEIRNALQSSADKGLTILLDSGNYESYWKQTQDQWTQERFHEVLAMRHQSFSFCFDEQAPPNNLDEHIKIVIEGFEKDQGNSDKPIIPIIHDTPEKLPEMCAAIAKHLGVNFISIPERRLGDGVFSRALTLRKIRQSLNDLGRYVGIHLLGTGNPMSIAIYSIEGADSFDGLEWCQTVIDHDTGFLFHSTQYDFFSDQTTWNELEIPFQAKMLAHNIEFYSFWMRRLQTAMTENNEISFCNTNFHPKFFNMCCSALGWELKE